MYAAAVQGNADAARRLLAAGAPPDAESAGLGSEGTPLCAAACWGHTETVRALLAHGADPNLREDQGTGLTPMQWARTGPYPETIAALHEAGADDATAASGPLKPRATARDVVVRPIR